MGALDLKQKLTISELYFFGHQGLDLQAIREELPLKCGSELGDYTEFALVCQKVKNQVKQLTGKESTDEALIFFEKKNVVFIGLPGSSNVGITYNPAPSGTIQLAPVHHQLYRAAMEASHRKLQSGSEEDAEKWRESRENVRKNAASDPQLLMDAIQQSSDAKDRYVAAHALGLIAQNRRHVELLTDAARDEDSVVRNNATAALGALIQSYAEIAEHVPCKLFVEMLSSPTWTDRNKAVFVLIGLVASRGAQIKTEIESNSAALASLEEMLEWPEAYANDARKLL